MSERKRKLSLSDFLVHQGRKLFRAPKLESESEREREREKAKLEDEGSIYRPTTVYALLHKSGMCVLERENEKDREDSSTFLCFFAQLPGDSPCLRRRHVPINSSPESPIELHNTTKGYALLCT